MAFDYLILKFTLYNGRVRWKLQDVGQSLRIVWLVVSLPILFCLAGPFLLGSERLMRLVPACERKSKYGHECPFCGMTTSFLAISGGRLDEAGSANRAGIPLYLIFVSNEICVLVFARRKVVNLCKR
jgi:hypothetical protein